MLGDVHRFRNFELESETEQASFYGVMLLNCIWEVPNLNLCVTTICSGWGFFFCFYFYFFILSKQMLDYYTSHYATIVVFHIFSNLFFTSAAITRSVTNSTVK
jgi:hypothetical protein